MSINIAEYDEIRAKLDEVKELCNFIPDVSSKDGYDKSKRVAFDVGKLLTALEKTRKDRKAYWIEGGKQVDSQAKTIRAELEAFQMPHKEAYKELDQLKKDRELARVSALEDRVETLRNMPELLRESSSGEVMCAMQSLNNEECLDFYELTKQALEARNASKSALSALYAQIKKREDEQEELDRLRKESEERARIDREEQIRRESSTEGEEKARQDEITKLKIEAKRLADEEAAREANTSHVGNIRKQAKEALMELGADEVLAKKIVLAINSGSIPNVSIKY